MDLNRIDAVYEKVSYYKMTERLTLDEWQFALRKKYATQHHLIVEKIGTEEVFSEYIVRNPDRKSSYSVSIRSSDNSRNFCTCFDFKTNSLGTCKHIEAILHQLRSKPKLKAILEKNYEPPYSSISLDYRGGRTVRLRIGTEHKEAFEMLRDRYFGEGNALLPEYYGSFDTIRKEGLNISPSFRCYPDAIDFVLDIREKTERVRHIDKHYGEGGKDAFGELMKTRLYSYQEEGIRFAAKAGRCLLADDMGLGKTIQGIGAAELLKREYGITKVLIICPTSLKYQWKSEIEKFTGSSVMVIEGLPHKRYEQYRGEELYKIVSYHTASNDVVEISATFPDLVILDEAQRIKNFLTKTSRNIKRIPSTYALVLTGTPLENKLEELYSVVQYLDPFILGPFHAFLAKHQIRTETGKITGYRELNSIGKTLSELMLRRKKAEVLSELPDRMDKMLLVPMTDRQLTMHDEFGSVVAKLVHKWRKLGFLPEKDRQRLLINLNMMRMVCDSSYILDQESRFDTKIEELMSIVQELISEGDDKMVVFSQWERMTRIVAKELDELGIGYKYLHGGVPSANREELFRGFNSNPEIRVFLSTDAGGTGLNLQSASTMVNLDIPWNPAVLEQRIGRIHRMGQKKKVTVINMVSAGTIEHRMTEVLKFKSSMAEGILDQGDDVIFMEESKFKKLMDTVERMVPGQVSEKTSSVAVEEEMISEKKDLKGVLDPEWTSDEIGPEPLTLFDDVEEAPKEAPGESNPEQLIQNGISFISGLARTFSDPEATRKLVSTLVKKDESDGKTYLKIPVENEKTVENILNLFGNLVKQMGR
jgi:SNF2 family DNA or RNA helicase